MTGNSNVNSSANSRPSKPRVFGTPFAAGVSGNPRGRPPISRDVRALARRYTERAVETLAALLDHDNPHVRRMAAVDLLDRGHGRPEVSLTASVETRHTIDREAILAVVAARAEALVSGRGGAEPPSLPDAPAGRLEIAAANAVIEVEVGTVAERGADSDSRTPERPRALPGVSTPESLPPGILNPSVASRNPSPAGSPVVPSLPLPPGCQRDPEGTPAP